MICEVGIYGMIIIIQEIMVNIRRTMITFIIQVTNLAQVKIFVSLEEVIAQNLQDLDYLYLSNARVLGFHIKKI